MPAVKLYKFDVGVFITRLSVYFYLYKVYILSAVAIFSKCMDAFTECLYICRVCLCVIRFLDFYDKCACVYAGCEVV